MTLNETEWRSGVSEARQRAVSNYRSRLRPARDLCGPLWADVYRAPKH